MDWDSVLKVVQEKAMGVGAQILGALALYIIGRC